MFRKIVLAYINKKKNSPVWSYGVKSNENRSDRLSRRELLHLEYSIIHIARKMYKSFIYEYMYTRICIRNIFQ